MTNNTALHLSVAAQNGVTELIEHVARIRSDADERGEGVISAAIAVLIMAVIGAAMYVAYKALFEKTSTAVTANVDKISA